MTLMPISLDDKYEVETGRVFLTGIQALVRLPMMQHELDRRAKLNTAGFISGYRGSPVGGLDQQLWRAQKFLDKHNIVFKPGLNEDLAVTAVWGSQQANLYPGAKYDGVFGMWYGKAPGVDRSGDAFRMPTPPAPGARAACSPSSATITPASPRRSRARASTRWSMRRFRCSTRPASRKCSTSESMAGRCRAMPAPGCR